ncbi:MAG: hypothetical protein ABWY06_05265 [Pseudomonas sp.]|uniref:hypothetical protein n=1 Tax=Pseudomonas sp. TaxID=306 RepID=UPI00339991C7
MNPNIAPIRKSMDWTYRTRGGNVAGDSTGGQPPGDGDLKERVEKLEAVLPDIQLRLVRVESKLDALGANTTTKAEMAAVGIMIAELKGTVSETMLAQTKWYIGTAAVLAGLAFAAARLAS